MIFGTFDIVHHGHMNLFLQAKKHGERLVVVVARDTRVKELKKDKPVHTEKERKKFLEQIRYIDEVLLGDKKDVYAVIKKIKPNIIVLGYDQKFFIDTLESKIHEFGLTTKVIRAKPYKHSNLKSKKIKEILQKNT